MAKSVSGGIWREPVDVSNREIRLFELYPSEWNDDLPRGRLFIQSLEANPKYEAISHSWGLPQPSIMLRLKYPDGYWPITANLCAALQRFRDPKKSRLFWIDALCINQYDFEERRQQIALLKDIFYNAQVVRVWLGTGSKSIHKAILIMDEIARGRKVNTIKVDKDQHIVTNEDLQTLSRFTTNDWWERLWVKQEIVLGKEVIFYHGLSYIRIDDVFKFMQYHPLEKADLDPEDNVRFKTSKERLSQLSDLMELGSMHGSSPRLRGVQLVKVLQACRTARCSDARDRVYGLLSVCRQLFDKQLGHKPMMDADYERSLVDIYTEFAYKLIDMSGSVYLFNQISPLHNSLRGLPSWVPDWTSTYDHDSKSLRINPRKYHAADYRPEKRSEAFPKFDNAFNPARIGLKGYTIGTVGSVEKEIYYHEPSGMVADYARRLPDTLSRWKHFYQYEQSQGRSSQAPGVAPAKVDLGPFASVMTGSYRPTNSSTELKILAEIEAHPKTATEEVNRVRQNIKNCRFFVCRLSRDEVTPGLGPPDTQLGDKVALLNGGATAYILRRREDENESYLFSLVGEAWIYGVMYGAHAPQRDPSTIWLE